MARGRNCHDAFDFAIYKHHLSFDVTQNKPADECLGIAIFGMADGSSKFEFVRDMEKLINIGLFFSPNFVDKSNLVLKSAFHCCNVE
jgi:hypothetical protein